MAIDSASKRQSALTFRLPFMRGLIPDGAINQADRQSIAFSYSGILAASAAVIVPVNIIRSTLYIKRTVRKTLFIKQRSRTGV